MPEWMSRSCLSTSTAPRLPSVCSWVPSPRMMCSRRSFRSSASGSSVLKRPYVGQQPDLGKGRTFIHCSTWNMNHRLDFDVIVIGGGHAGAEAARVCARGGARVAMVTMLREAIGRMSCNPAIRRLAKGNLVKEIDALGGLMGEATDRAGILFKILNRSKGPAVQGPRAQCDRDLYAAAVQQILAAEANVTVVQGSVSALLHEEGAIRGATLKDGTRLDARAVIV